MDVIGIDISTAKFDVALLIDKRTKYAADSDEISRRFRLNPATCSD